MLKLVHDKFSCLNRHFPHCNSNYPLIVICPYIHKGILSYYYISGTHVEPVVM